MKKIGMIKLLTIGMAVFLLGYMNLSCKKGKTPEPEVKAEEVHETKKEKKEVKHEEKEEKKEAKHEEEDKKEESKEDGKKVDSVKGAFQYTGKEMDKGFKKTGKSMKKFFVGDEDKK